MTDTSHLNALRLGLSHERARLEVAKSAKEIAARTVWVRQYEKEIEAELKFLGTTETPIEEMTDDELFAELSA